MEFRGQAGTLHRAIPSPTGVVCADSDPHPASGIPITVASPPEPTTHGDNGRRRDGVADGQKHPESRREGKRAKQSTMGRGRTGHSTSEQHRHHLAANQAPGPPIHSLALPIPHPHHPRLRPALAFLTPRPSTYVLCPMHHHTYPQLSSAQLREEEQMKDTKGVISYGPVKAKETTRGQGIACSNSFFRRRLGRASP